MLSYLLTYFLVFSIHYDDNGTGPTLKPGRLSGVREQIASFQCHHPFACFSPKCGFPLMILHNNSKNLLFLSHWKQIWSFRSKHYVEITSREKRHDIASLRIHTNEVLIDAQIVRSEMIYVSITVFSKFSWYT